MDFFRHQERARHLTARLIGLLSLTVAGLTYGLYLVCGYLFADTLGPKSGWWDPVLFAYVSACTLALIFGGSIYKIAQLRGGGPSVARSLGGERVDHGTKDAKLRVLVNVVEEMAIASGLPIPQVWILEHEQGINAFAAGLHTGDAVIAVTRGALRQLNRDELQGVIAHEFSHIIHGDMALNIRLMGLVHGLLCINVAGSMILRGSTRQRYSAARTRVSMPVLGLGLALWLAGYMGTLLARMIKASVSRQREFLADAAAVQFTRNPEGIGSALKRIAGFLPPRVVHLSRGSHIRSAHAEEVSHMFFSSGFMRAASLMNTHPPLLARIRRIQPDFRSRHGSATDAITPQSSVAETARGFAAGPSPEMLLDRVGNPCREDLDTGRELLLKVPEELRGAAHDAYSARALVYALLLSPNSSARRYQLQSIQGIADSMTLQETFRLAPTLTSLGHEFRLPLVDLALPALRDMSADQSRTFLRCVKALIDDEHRSGFFELCLQRVLLHHLESTRRAPRLAEPSARKTFQFATEAVIVLSTLAHRGHSARAAALTAYGEGIAVLDLEGDDLTILPEESCMPSSFATALDRLALIGIFTKRKLLLACARSIASDGIIETAETELLRAIAATFDCPLPPLRPRNKAEQCSSPRPTEA